MTKELGQETAELNETTLTKEIAKSIENIITQKKSMELAKQQVNEAIEAVAKRIGVKKGVLSRRVDLIIKEEQKGGEMKSKSDDITFVEKYFTINNPVLKQD